MSEEDRRRVEKVREQYENPGITSEQYQHQIRLLLRVIDDLVWEVETPVPSNY